MKTTILLLSVTLCLLSCAKDPSTEKSVSETTESATGNTIEETPITDNIEMDFSKMEAVDSLPKRAKAVDPSEKILGPYSVMGFKVGQKFNPELVPVNARINSFKTSNTDRDGNIIIGKAKVIVIEGENIISLKVAGENEIIQNISVMSPKIKSREGAHIGMKLPRFLKLYPDSELSYESAKRRMAVETSDYPGAVFQLDQDGYRGGPDRVNIQYKDILRPSDFAKSTEIIKVIYE